MGDNLVAARQFSGLCQDNIAALISQKVCETPAAIAALLAISHQAADLRARSIARAAENAIDEFSGVHSPSQRAGALLTLNKLVRQYTDGLDEIAPVEDEVFAGLTAEDISKWKQVRETFVPLQRFAKTGDEISALSALAALGPFAAGGGGFGLGESFELLMPAITDESLRQARECAKSVSVSYATDDIFMTESMAQDVQDALIEICQGLVESSVEAPNQRQSRGLSGAAHIAITAKRSEDSFNILVSCEGPLPTRNLFEGPKVRALKEGGAAFNVNRRGNLVRVEVANLPVSGRQENVEFYDQVLGMRA